MAANFDPYTNQLHMFQRGSKK